MAREDSDMGIIKFKISLNRCKENGFYNKNSTFLDLEKNLQKHLKYKLLLDELRVDKNIDNYRKGIHDNKGYEKTSIAIVLELPEEIINKFALSEASNKTGKQEFQNKYIFNNNNEIDFEKELDMENTMPKVEKQESNLKELFDEYLRKGQIEFITFHPSYSYEEFIEGITVETLGENISTASLQYKLKPGVFKNMCKKALAAAIGFSSSEADVLSWKQVYGKYVSKSPVNFDDAHKYVLIIDEINRGDMAKIFGELITLLEADKRLGEENELIVKLPCSTDMFGVPPNLYIIATMNTADRSIALLDVALRRRFGFIEMNPDFKGVLSKHIEENKKDLKKANVYDALVRSKECLEKINERICKENTIGRDRQIGHSFLFKVKTTEDLVLIWKHEILPLLEEYCYGDYNKINKLLFGKDFDTEWVSESGGIRNIEDISKMLKDIV